MEISGELKYKMVLSIVEIKFMMIIAEQCHGCRSVFVCLWLTG